MKPLLISVALLALTASASAQQMIGPAFGLTAEQYQFYAEQSHRTAEEIRLNDLARHCQWQKACIDKHESDKLDRDIGRRR